MGSWASSRSKSQILQVMFPGVNQPKPETDHSLPTSFFNGAGSKSDCVVSVVGMIWSNTLELTFKEVLHSYLR